MTLGRRLILEVVATLFDVLGAHSSTDGCPRSMAILFKSSNAAILGAQGVLFHGVLLI
jgi:hypothetical protein